jgi:hemoglobin
MTSGAYDCPSLKPPAFDTISAADRLSVIACCVRPRVVVCLIALKGISSNSRAGERSDDMATQGSLYDRLGGIDAITAVVRAVADRQLKDDRINQKFARTNLDRLIKEFVDQICEATGGPCTYTGRSMTETHHNMGVTNGEFDAFVEDVVAVLDDFKVGKAEQDELLSLLAPLRGEIVEVESNQTGTPLPSEYIPAPAL